MSLNEDILRQKVDILIEDIYMVQDELDIYLETEHKSKVNLAKAMKKVRQSYKSLEEEMRNYKKFKGN